MAVRDRRQYKQRNAKIHKPFPDPSNDCSLTSLVWTHAELGIGDVSTADDNATIRKSGSHWGTWCRQRDIRVLTRMEPASEGLTAEVGQEYLAHGMLEDGGSFYGMGPAHVKN